MSDMKCKLSAGFGGILAGTGLAMLVHVADPASAQILKPEEPAVIAVGEQVYAGNCASCHGEALEGETNWRSPDAEGYMPAPPHDETGHTWHHSERLLFSLTKYGVVAVTGLKDHKTRMPIYDGVLSDDEIIAVLSYIKSRWPSDLQRRHTEMSAHDQ